MRHKVFGRQLKRNVGERRSLFMNLIKSVVAHNGIRTSIAKAKAIQPTIEKLITKAKRAKASDKMQIAKTVADKKTEQTLYSWAKNRFASRVSGYTRITRVGKRLGDASDEVLLSFVDSLPEKSVEKKEEKTKKPVKKAK